MIPFPWQMAMRVGLGVLGLSPAQFWAMTPRELAAAIEGRAGHTAPGTPPSRAGLDALMVRFPDTTEGREND